MSTSPMLVRVLCVLCLLAAGCESTDTPAEPVQDMADATAAAPSGVPDVPAGDVGPVSEADQGAAAPEEDLSDLLFPRDQVLDVAIVIQPDDWEELRFQQRTIMDILGPSCLDGPPANPFTYFPATVTVDGVTLDNVGVRKKGFFGSLSADKPALKVKFHEYVEGQSHLDMVRMTLNNVRQDASYMNTCMSYLVFEAAGVPAPRCAFARVSVNGQDLGLYVHVDSIKKPFLARRFLDDGGNLYEGTLSDFRPDWVKSFEKKTNKGEDDWSDLHAVLDALEVADGGLLAAVDEHIDLDAFLTFWATEVLVSHWDGYAGNTNNFYLYRDPETDRFQFIPWGADATFFSNIDLFDDNPVPASVMAQGLLTRRIYLHPEGVALYTARLAEILDTVWDEAWLFDEAKRMKALILPELLPKEEAAALQEMDRVFAFIYGRRKQIADELGGGPAAWPFPLRDPPCFEPIGAIAGSVQTTWGMLEVQNVLANGTGSLSVDPDPWSMVITDYGAAAGPHPEQIGRTEIRLFAMVEDGAFVILVITVDDDLLVDGASVPLDFQAAESYLIYWSPAIGEPKLMGYVMDGGFEIEKGSAQPGSALKLAFSAGLYAAGGGE